MKELIDDPVNNPGDLPLVSVVISCYNHQDYIGDAIDSVMSQTYPNIEILISDDGSTDNSRDIIRAKVSRWENKDRVKLFLNDNNTTFACVEEAFHNASGKYVAGIGGDDMMKPQKIEKQVDFLENSNEKYGLCFTWIECIGGDGRITDIVESLFNIDNMSRSQLIETLFFKGNCLSAPSVMMRKDLYELYGGYDFSFRQTQDYVLWLKYIVNYDLYVIPEKLTVYRKVSGSVSDAESDYGTKIRAAEEKTDAVFDIMINIDDHDFNSMFPDTQSDYNTGQDIMCKKIKLFYEHAINDGNLLAGQIAARLYFHYIGREGVADLLKERYGISRKQMYDFISKYTYAAYAYHSDKDAGILRKMAENHRLSIDNIEKNNAEMVNELLDIIDQKSGKAVTIDHVIALYDFCIENNNGIEDFENIIHELKGKAEFI